MDGRGPVTGAVAGVRQSLLARFGVFGIRLATTLLRQDVGNAAELAAELVRRSGLHELQEVLDTQFAERRDLLKARSALLALDSVLQGDPRPGSEHVAVEVERILAGAHELVELRLLSALRSQAVRLPEPCSRRPGPLLGDSGGPARSALGLPVHSDPAVLREAAVDALVRWRSTRRTRCRHGPLPTPAAWWSGRARASSRGSVGPSDRGV